MQWTVALLTKFGIFFSFAIIFLLHFIKYSHFWKGKQLIYLITSVKVVNCFPYSTQCYCRSLTCSLGFPHQERPPWLQLVLQPWSHIRQTRHNTGGPAWSSHTWPSPLFEEKNCMGGDNVYTNLIQTDIAITRLTRPRGPSQWKFITTDIGFSV